MSTAIQKAIQKAGGLVELARRVGVSYQVVQYWAKQRVPSEYCLTVEKETGVSRYELRPDVYGQAPEHEAA